MPRRASAVPTLASRRSPARLCSSASPCAGEVACEIVAQLPLARNLLPQTRRCGRCARVEGALGVELPVMPVERFGQGSEALAWDIRRCATDFFPTSARASSARRIPSGVAPSVLAAGCKPRPRPAPRRAWGGAWRATRPSFVEQEEVRRAPRELRDERAPRAPRPCASGTEKLKRTTRSPSSCVSFRSVAAAERLSQDEREGRGRERRACSSSRTVRATRCRRGRAGSAESRR